MPGAEEREPGDPNRPSVGEVGDEMQERTEEDESAREEDVDRMAPGRSATDDGDTEGDAVEPNEPG